METDLKFRPFRSALYGRRHLVGRPADRHSLLLDSSGICLYRAFGYFARPARCQYGQPGIGGFLPEGRTHRAGDRSAGDGNRRSPPPILRAAGVRAQRLPLCASVVPASLRTAPVGADELSEGYDRRGMSQFRTLRPRSGPSLLLPREKGIDPLKHKERPEDLSIFGLFYGNRMLPTRARSRRAMRPK